MLKEMIAKLDLDGKRSVIFVPLNATKAQDVRSAVIYQILFVYKSKQEKVSNHTTFSGQFLLCDAPFENLASCIHQSKYPPQGDEYIHHGSRHGNWPLFFFLYIYELKN